MNDSWIIYIPVIVGVLTLSLGIWNARTSAKKDKVETKATETDKYIDALKGQVEVLITEFGSFKESTKDKTDDLTKRMIACEVARDDLAKRNLELEREKINLLTQLVAAGVTAQFKKGSE